MKRKYLLVLKKGISPQQFEELKNLFDMEVDIDYGNLKRHYLVTFDDSKKQAVKEHPYVIHATEDDAPVPLLGKHDVRTSFDASGANWGLARITQHHAWNDAGWFPVRGQYVYSRTGEGVDAYVIDTGIRRTHQDFEGRIEVIYDHYRPESDPLYGEDTQGHGTHVASIVAGKKYGVAKKAKIIVARIFDSGSAPLSAVIGGINACLEHHTDKVTTSVNRPSVMNLSIGGPKVTIEEEALNDCIESGIILVAAAGNDGKNLDDTEYNILPAEIARAITVGAVDVKDRICSFSNYGSSVDLFGPGAYIAAASIEHDTAESVKSGTSMAAPHAAGVLILKVQGENIGTDAEFVRIQHDWLVNESVSNTILLHEAAATTLTPNRMLFSPFTATDIEEVFGTIEPEPVIEPAPIPTPTAEPTPVDNRPVIRRNTRLDRLMRYYRGRFNVSAAKSTSIQSNIVEFEQAYETLSNAATVEEVKIALESFFEVKKQIDELV